MEILLNFETILFSISILVLKPLADEIYVSTDGEQNMQENSCHNSDNGQRWTPQSTIPWWPESLNSAANPRLRARSKIAKKITWEIKDCENSTLSDSSLLSRGWCLTLNFPLPYNFPFRCCKSLHCYTVTRNSGCNWSVRSKEQQSSALASRRCFWKSAMLLFLTVDF